MMTQNLVPTKVEPIPSSQTEVPKRIIKTQPVVKSLDKTKEILESLETTQDIIPTIEHEDPQNWITIQGKEIHILPTKVKYFRNKAASAYKLLKLIPLNEFLSYEAGTFDTRSSDQMLFDFLCAVFDDQKFVTKNYNNFDMEEIDQLIKMFGRLNHIDEKEEAAKKQKAAMNP